MVFSRKPKTGLTQESHLFKGIKETSKPLTDKSEINKLHAQVKEKGFSLVPLNFHFSHGYVKVTVGLVTGKKLYDKRQDMAERDAKRDIAKRIKEQQKY